LQRKTTDAGGRPSESARTSQNECVRSYAVVSIFWQLRAGDQAGEAVNDFTPVLLEMLRSPFWRAVVILAEILWAVSVGLKIWMFPLERSIQKLQIEKLKLEVTRD